MKTLGIILLTALVASVGCSNQYRSVPMDDHTFVKASLNEILGVSSASTNEVAQFKQLSEMPGASLYYSDSVAYGAVMSVASLASFSFFDRPDLWYGMISEVRIFFVDVFTTQGRQAGLLMAIKENGAQDFQVKAFLSTRPSEVVGGEFVAVLGNNGQERLTLRSMYVDEDDELEAIIRLDVSEFDGSALETYIGQFSTLVGYQVF